MNSVKMKGVEFSYDKTDENGKTIKKQVLKNLTFEIEQGSFVALLGENGSGKSTCAKLINGLLRADQGEVEVFGINLKDSSKLLEVRKRVGTVFQNPDNQQIASMVEDDIAFGPENIGMAREDIEKAITYSLKVAGLEDFRHSQISRLSGGQKQRVAIAGAIAINPKILILDEATSMLDPKGRREVLDVVKKLNKENGMTVIDITHYMDEAVEADKIMILSKGEIVKTGTPTEVFQDYETVKRCGLELPKASIIAKELKAFGMPLSDGILSKESLLKELCKLLQKT